MVLYFKGKNMNRTAKQSFGEPHICLQDWPSDEECFLQCGEKGVVMSKQGAYQTAFFEAFPKKPSTFIRGQGSSIAEAEKNAWDKYQRILACDGHEYKRHGEEHGVCTKCGLFTSHCLPPEFNCVICNKPHVNYHYDNKKYCLKHYLSTEDYEFQNEDDGDFMSRSLAKNKNYQKLEKLEFKILKDFNLIDSSNVDYVEHNRLNDAIKDSYHARSVYLSNFLERRNVQMNFGEYLGFDDYIQYDLRIYELLFIDFLSHDKLIDISEDYKEELDKLLDIKLQEIENKKVNTAS